ncbi:hypothetical protein F5Y09DRAFT_235464 [Xylaria sp. FL1042]|nr:hypothetical protein F5Y09DRAFT_235464 [Xylaria sp. FL1042]
MMSKVFGQWSSGLEKCQSTHQYFWSLFRVPRILFIAPRASQSSPVLTLPNEVLLEIFLHVDPLERLLLALTCKRLLAIASLVTIRIPSADLHRYGSNNCRAMVALLQMIQPLDQHGQPDEKAWGICGYCYRHRPKDKKYWEGRKSEPARRAMLIGEKARYGDAVEVWCAKWTIPYKCPECWCENAAWEHQSRSMLVSDGSSDGSNE